MKVLYRGLILLRHYSRLENGKQHDEEIVFSLHFWQCIVYKTSLIRLQNLVLYMHVESKKKPKGQVTKISSNERTRQGLGWLYKKYKKYAILLLYYCSKKTSPLYIKVYSLNKIAQCSDDKNYLWWRIPEAITGECGNMPQNAFIEIFRCVLASL